MRLYNSSKMFLSLLLAFLTLAKIPNSSSQKHLNQHQKTQIQHSDNHEKDIQITPNALELNPQQFKFLSQKYIMIDTRDDTSDGLIKKAYWMSNGLDFSRWLGLVLNKTDGFLIVAELGKWQSAAKRFFDLGYNNLQGYNGFTMQQWTYEKSYPRIIHFDDLKNLGQYTHLDVRNPDQWIKTGVVEGSSLIPLPTLDKRSDQLLNKKQIVVNCAKGIRARFAYSILQRKNIDSMVLAQSFDDFQSHGIPMVKLNSLPKANTSQ